jgi:hypothetical protein
MKTGLKERYEYSRERWQETWDDNLVAIDHKIKEFLDASEELAQEKYPVLRDNLQHLLDQVRRKRDGVPAAKPENPAPAEADDEADPLLQQSLMNVPQDTEVHVSGEDRPDAEYDGQPAVFVPDDSFWRTKIQERVLAIQQADRDKV